MKKIGLVVVIVGAFLLPDGQQVATAQERQIGGGVGLTLFKDRNFRGRSTTLRDDQANFQFFDFNDEVSSLRVGRGERWEVCEHANYQGRCAVVSGEEGDLRDSGWNDNISSARRLRGGPGGGGDGGFGRGRGRGGSNRGFITLYDQRDFRGRSYRVDDRESALNEFAGRAQSVRVSGGGAWELCERAGFSGRCIVVTDDLNNLGAVGLSNRVASVRPAARPR